MSRQSRPIQPGSLSELELRKQSRATIIFEERMCKKMS
jgi:hypothetical protein